MAKKQPKRDRMQEMLAEIDYRREQEAKRAPVYVLRKNGIDKVVFGDKARAESALHFYRQEYPLHDWSVLSRI